MDRVSNNPVFELAAKSSPDTAVETSEVRMLENMDAAEAGTLPKAGIAIIFL